MNLFNSRGNGTTSNVATQTPRTPTIGVGALIRLQTTASALFDFVDYIIFEILNQKGYVCRVLTLSH